MKLSGRAEEILERLCGNIIEEKKDCPQGKLASPERGHVQPAKEAVQMVCLLKDMEAEDRGTIAFLATNDKGRLHKLMVMGALPGLRITVIQKFPSYVFQIGQSQFAIDKEMAEGIYVLLEKDRRENSVESN